MIALLDTHGGWWDPVKLVWCNEWPEDAPSGEEEIDSEGAGTSAECNNGMMTPSEDRVNGKVDSPSKGDGDMHGTEERKWHGRTALGSGDEGVK